MENEALVDKGLELIKARFQPAHPSENKDWVKWCDLLNVKAPHPLQARIGDDVKELQEIYNYCKEVNQQDPESELKGMLSKIPNVFAEENMTGKVLKYVRLLKSYRSTKGLLEAQEKALQGMFQ